LDVVAYTYHFSYGGEYKYKDWDPGHSWKKESPYKKKKKKKKKKNPRAKRAEDMAPSGRATALEPQDPKFNFNSVKTKQKT
jgi:hypothetical protein